MISVQKTNPILANIDVNDKDEIAISTYDGEFTLTEDDTGNLFQNTSSEEDLETE